jgi:hypothetical protein
MVGERPRLACFSPQPIPIETRRTLAPRLRATSFRSDAMAKSPSKYRPKGASEPARSLPDTQDAHRRQYDTSDEIDTARAISTDARLRYWLMVEERSPATFQSRRVCSGASHNPSARWSNRDFSEHFVTDTATRQMGIRWLVPVLSPILSATILAFRSLSRSDQYRASNAKPPCNIWLGCKGSSRQVRALSTPAEISGPGIVLVSRGLIRS